MISQSRAEQLNRGCDCESVGAEDLAAFYSNTPVFISAAHQRQMEAVIAAICRVVALPGYQRAVLADSPAIAALPNSTQGVFSGFDFHVGADGPKLIEINTNAGGAMLNAAAQWRHPDCCNELNPAVRVPAGRAQLEAAFMAMFRAEWQLARGARPLRRIAIVDDQPAQQFLHAEFRLFQALFEAHGIEAFIADAAELELTGNTLSHSGRAIDLVYNRLTDFHFEEPVHAPLRRAYETDAAVITPHPRAHALYADKRNLVRLTDPAFLQAVGASPADAERLLSGIPHTREVSGCEEAWWRERKEWFFKPAAGFGSRGVYRGDKLTRRVFGEIMKGGYVAQKLAPPGERLHHRATLAQSYKVDLRCYVYDGVVQLMTARLYQGQATNFRTAGGGFAPVIELR
jgi:hypothetical protein